MRCLCWTGCFRLMPSPSRWPGCVSSWAWRLFRRPNSSRAVAEADARGVLSALAEAFQSGAEPEEVASDLAACFRDAMLFSVGGVESVGLHLSEGRQEDLEMISAALPADYLASGVGLADEAARAAKSSSTPRAVVEAMLLKLVFDLGAEWHRMHPRSRAKKKSLSKSAK